MKTKILSVAILILLTALIFSCGAKEEEPVAVENFDAVQTQAVETFAYALTQTQAAVPTLTSTPTLEPTATLTATPTGEASPTPTLNPCYNLMYIKDLTVPDGSEMKPNEKFTKTWLVQNTGGCAWAPGFTFVNVGGDALLAQSVKLTEPVPVGLKYELSLEMVAPTGVYGLIQSTWQMSYEPGIYFGDPLTVNIVVNDPNAPTPTATP